MYTYIHIYIFSSTCSSLEIVKLFSKRKPVLEIWVLVFNVVARGHRPPSLLEDLENGSRPVRANRFSCFFFSRVIGNCMKPPLNEPTIFASFFSFGTFFVFLFSVEISQYYEIHIVRYISAIKNFQLLNYLKFFVDDIITDSEYLKR